LVEDDQALRANYGALSKQGYEVLPYGNRHDAKQAFSQRLPELAIIDIGLQDEIDGGFTLCQQLRSLSKTLPHLLARIAALFRRTELLNPRLQVI
jgi:two-component system OmpR family response regulator